MLQLNEISKEYKTGDLVQAALNGVSLSLRDNEFVAILGPSGSGKTTLLNIIGGLDRYDNGDLIIDGISTKKYADRDWDSYRNHTIGFVFQSYNLIPHQTILSNVELALTISGISKSERKNRAKEALEKVGLLEHIHKRPNQLSGGQMQRVAIARALVNNPKILLADEPTGALDSETSVQIMELLKEVASDRLVVMVTHNPELAEQYATRIVKVKDGLIIDDTDPFIIDNNDNAEHKNMGKSSMSFGTSLSLSFNNLRSKFARTTLTALAGSIGIIGIALIIAISNGVNQYINDIQQETMTAYPITIEGYSLDLTSVLFSEAMNNGVYGEAGHDLDKVYVNNSGFELAQEVTSNFTENNLTAFKEYLDNEESEIHQYTGKQGIIYRYDVEFEVFGYDPEGEIVNTDGSTLSGGDGSDSLISAMEGMGPAVLPDNFSEMLPGEGGDGVSTAIKDTFDLVYGSWPENYDEIVLMLDRNHEIGATTLYQIGVLPISEYDKIMDDLRNRVELSLTDYSWEYSDLCKHELFLVPACERYIKGEDNLYKHIGIDDDAFKDIIDTKSIKLKIVGIIVPSSDDSTKLLSTTFGYTRELTDYIIEITDNSEVVIDQRNTPDVSVLTGRIFEPASDEEKVVEVIEVISNLGVTDKAMICRSMAPIIYQDTPEVLAGMQMMGEQELADQLMLYISNDPDIELMIGLYDNLIKDESFDGNLKSFGVINVDAPSAINIYADTFEDKDMINECIERYNEGTDEKNHISYTDLTGLLMSSVTTIINVISYVLIAFVSVSLVVSSIMIGIITYISVLERTKEIGILRAIGASKRNISQVFTAETIIIGLFSGILGIVITLLLMVPGNAILRGFIGDANVSAILPVDTALLLIGLSTILTLIGGWIPSKKAAKKDPVTALRTE